MVIRMIIRSLLNKNKKKGNLIMAVKQSYAMVNGVKMLATYDSDTQLWTVEGNAPADSSWSQPDHVYKIELHAEDEAGNSTVMTADDKTYGNQLKLRVLEKNKTDSYDRITNQRISTWSICTGHQARGQRCRRFRSQHGYCCA